MENKMDKKKKILSGVGAVAVLIAGYLIVDHLRFVETDNAQIEGHAVMLAAKVGGFIVKTNVADGQRVKKGDVLVEIDDRDYRNTLAQVKSDLVSIEARKRDSETNSKRLRDLYSKGAVSQQQLDTVSTSFAEAKAKFDAVSAQVAQAELNLDYTKIRAPTDGIIARKSAEVGQLANPGVPLVGFVGTEERWITANFKETEIADVKPGAEVEIVVDAIPSRRFKGVVEAISSATGATFTLLPPDNATGNFTKVVQRVPVKIALKDLSLEDRELLRAGLSVVVKVHRK
jgi:membrane fusion protein, multidrug efflux system